MARTAAHSPSPLLQDGGLADEASASASASVRPPGWGAGGSTSSRLLALDDGGVGAPGCDDALAVEAAEELDRMAQGGEYVCVRVCVCVRWWVGARARVYVCAMCVLLSVRVYVIPGAVAGSRTGSQRAGLSLGLGVEDRAQE